MNKKTSIFVLFLLFCSHFCYAAVTATIDRKTVSLGESLSLTIQLENANQTPDLAPLKPLFDIYNTSTSSQTSVLNGKKTSNIAYIVTLLPKKVGSQEIPEIQVGNDKTLPIKFTVTQPSASDLGGENSGLFITAEASSKDAYVNMPILYTLKLYYAENLSDVSMEPITIDQADMIPFGKNVQYQAMQHGKNYQVIEQQFLITAHQAGRLQIPALTIKAEIIQNDFSTFFGTQSTKPVVVKSVPVALDIKAIPESIAHDQWLPASSVHLNSHWSDQSQALKVGEPITRIVTLTATGILSANLPDIDFPVPENSNAYPDKIQTKDFVENHLPAGTKIYKIAYIPTAEGKLIFPKVELSWWDTKTHTLKKAEIAEKIFSVAPGKLSTHGVSPQSLPHKNQESAQIKIVYSDLWLYIAMALLVLWLLTILCFIFLLKKKPNPVKDIATNRKTFQKINAGIDKKQPLKMLKKACEQEALESASQALVSWAKLHFNARIYTVMDVADYLDDRNNGLKELIHQLNAAIYSKVAFSGFDKLYQAVKLASTTEVKQEKKHPLESLYPKF